MSLTVAALIAAPALGTRSLTPGIGEDRVITWAHSCELPEPWRWLGAGALVMTTGLPVPGDAAGQCAYFEGMAQAGIAGIAIGERMSAPPLADEALARAAQLGFPVLETAYDVPFITLAQAVIETEARAQDRRLRIIEGMYGTLRRHTHSGETGGLLHDLGALIGGTLSLHPHAAPIAPDEIQRFGVDRYRSSLTTVGEPELHFHVPGSVDHGLLQHASGIVSSALSVQLATRRSTWLFGSVLLGNLSDGTIPAELAERLVAAHELNGPYLLCTWLADDARGALDTARSVLAAHRTPALLTVKDRHGLLLLPRSASGTLDDIVECFGTVGVSAPFSGFVHFPTVLEQARLALTRAGTQVDAGLLRFDGGVASIFLPEHPDQLRTIARHVLGPLQDWDAHRGTPFVHTLHVFLAENRSWVRAAERLFVHRQTLVARIARIEAILQRDLTTMEDSAECWLGIRAAVACGELDPLLPHHTNV